MYMLKYYFKVRPFFNVERDSCRVAEWLDRNGVSGCVLCLQSFERFKPTTWLRILKQTKSKENVHTPGLSDRYPYVSFSLVICMCFLLISRGNITNIYIIGRKYVTAGAFCTTFSVSVDFFWKQMWLRSYKMRWLLPTYCKALIHYLR